ncbi:MAG: hypothetical protein V3T55_03840 [Anaerolineales bacterium]
MTGLEIEKLAELLDTFGFDPALKFVSAIVSGASISQNRNDLELPREFKLSLGTSIFAFTSGILFGSFFFYYFLFPVRTDFPWRELARLLMLGLSLWIYYELLFSSLKLKLTESGIETTSILSNQEINWEDIDKIEVMESYKYGGLTLRISGRKSRIRFYLGSSGSRRCRRDMPIVLKLIKDRTGKVPEEWEKESVTRT